MATPPARRERFMTLVFGAKSSDGAHGAIGHPRPVAGVTQAYRPIIDALRRSLIGPLYVSLTPLLFMAAHAALTRSQNPYPALLVFALTFAPFIVIVAVDAFVRRANPAPRRARSPLHKLQDWNSDDFERLGEPTDDPNPPSAIQRLIVFASRPLPTVVDGLFTLTVIAAYLALIALTLAPERWLSRVPLPLPLGEDRLTTIYGLAVICGLFGLRRWSIQMRRHIETAAARSRRLAFPALGDIPPLALRSSWAGRGR